MKEKLTATPLKAARERARLRKAGYDTRTLGDGQGNVYRDWYYTLARDGEKGFTGTRSEAVTHLNRSEALAAKPSKSPPKSLPKRPR